MTIPREDRTGFDAPRWARWMLSRSPLKIALLVLATAAIMVGHYQTPATAEHSVLHDLHRQLLTIPIVLAAFWFGWRGGLLAAVLIGTFFFPHLMSMMHDQQHHIAMGHLADPTETLDRALEMLIYLAVGTITGALIDRLRAEEDRLRHANAELAARTGQLQRAMDELTQRTREVFEAEEQLRRADRLSAIGQLTTGLAHEIRNPLASIRGAAEILGDGGVGEAQRTEFSRILLDETQRLDRVLGNFLDYARTQKAVAGAPASSDLRTVMDKLGALLSRPLADARVEMVVNVPRDLPSLAINADLLQQVMLNLALNAIQAIGREGRLTIEAAREGPGGAVAIRVRDTGPGIPAALAGRIFDPFFTTKPQGLGLGLAIVNKIVSGCGGQIAVEPETPSGACFRITLPQVK